MSAQPQEVAAEDPFAGLPLLIPVPRAAKLLGISRAAAYWRHKVAAALDERPEGRARTLSGPSPDLSPARSFAPGHAMALRAMMAACLRTSSLPGCSGDCPSHFQAMSFPPISERSFSEPSLMATSPPGRSSIARTTAGWSVMGLVIRTNRARAWQVRPGHGPKPRRLWAGTGRGTSSPRGCARAASRVELR